MESWHKMTYFRAKTSVIGYYRFLKSLTVEGGRGWISVLKRESNIRRR